MGVGTGFFVGVALGVTPGVGVVAEGFGMTLPPPPGTPPPGSVGVPEAPAGVVALPGGVPWMTCRSTPDFAGS